jgi:uncharacterized protein YjbI with pentapeptide repeats
MRKELIKDYRIVKNLKNERIADKTFNGLNVTSSNIKDCEFVNVHFKHCKLGSNSKYTNCKFVNCKMEGAYSTLGNPTTYSNCTFENCNFTGRMIFMGAIFENCKFSGIFTNNVIIDEKRWFKKYFTFTNCDFTNANFENLTINGTRTFKDCQLPSNYAS